MESERLKSILRDQEACANCKHFTITSKNCFVRDPTPEAAIDHPGKYACHRWKAYDGEGYR